MLIVVHDRGDSGRGNDPGQKGPFKQTQKRWILAVFAGSLCGDQLFFFLGRRHSTFRLNRRPAWKSRLERANRLIDRFQTPLILGFRFRYRLRTVMPFAIGISTVPVLRFVFLNDLGALAGAVVWVIYLYHRKESKHTKGTIPTEKLK